MKLSRLALCVASALPLVLGSSLRALGPAKAANPANAANKAWSHKLIGQGSFSNEKDEAGCDRIYLHVHTQTNEDAKVNGFVDQEFPSFGFKAKPECMELYPDVTYGEIEGDLVVLAGKIFAGHELPYNDNDQTITIGTHRHYQFFLPHDSTLPAQFESRNKDRSFGCNFICTDKDYDGNCDALWNKECETGSIKVVVRNK